MNIVPQTRMLLTYDGMPVIGYCVVESMSIDNTSIKLRMLDLFYHGRGPNRKENESMNYHARVIVVVDSEHPIDVDGAIRITGCVECEEERIRLMYLKEIK